MSDELGHAKKIARQIRDYWARYGADVDVFITRDPPPHDPINHNVPGYFVRSNMVNGLPRKVGRDVISTLSDPRNVYAR